MGVVFDQAHATKTVPLNCRTVFVACGSYQIQSFVFTPPRPILHLTLFLKENFFNLLVTLLSLYNIIKLHYETF